MFNVLSGLQEGSHSVMVTSRFGPAGLVKGTAVATSGTGNTIAKADNSTVGLGAAVEYVFEDLLTQTSGKYTVISGIFEAETDQVSGTPAVGTFLKPGTSGTAGLLVAATLSSDASLVCAKVVDSYVVKNDAQAASVTAYRIRTL